MLNADAKTGQARDTLHTIILMQYLLKRPRTRQPQNFAILKQDQSKNPKYILYTVIQYLQ